MLRLMDFLFRCFHNLAHKETSPEGTIITAFAGLCIFLGFFNFGVYCFLTKYLGTKYLSASTGFLALMIVVMGAGGSLLYYTRRPSSYWKSYQGNTGGKRVVYALLGVLSFVLLFYVGSHV